MEHFLKVYKDTPEYKELLKIRFPINQSHPVSFAFNGHRWAYKYSSFDDKGEFDLLYRFSEDHHLTPDSKLRDKFAMAALKGLLSNPQRNMRTAEYVETAYEYANHMLARRTKK